MKHIIIYILFILVLADPSFAKKDKPLSITDITEAYEGLFLQSAYSYDLICGMRSKNVWEGDTVHFLKRNGVSISASKEMLNYDDKKYHLTIDKSNRFVIYNEVDKNLRKKLDEEEDNLDTIFKTIEKFFSQSKIESDILSNEGIRTFQLATVDGIYSFTVKIKEKTKQISYFKISWFQADDKEIMYYMELLNYTDEKKIMNADFKINQVIKKEKDELVLTDQYKNFKLINTKYSYEK